MKYQTKRTSTKIHAKYLHWKIIFMHMLYKPIKNYAFGCFEEIPLQRESILNTEQEGQNFMSRSSWTWPSQQELHPVSQMLEASQWTNPGLWLSESKQILILIWPTLGHKGSLRKMCPHYLDGSKSSQSHYGKLTS